MPPLPRGCAPYVVYVYPFASYWYPFTADMPPDGRGVPNGPGRYAPCPTVSFYSLSIPTNKTEPPNGRTASALAPPDFSAFRTVVFWAAVIMPAPDTFCIILSMSEYGLPEPEEGSWDLNSLGRELVSWHYSNSG